MTKKTDNFRKKIFEHGGYKIDATKGFLRFNILDDENDVVGTVRINKSAYDTHNTAMLIIHDSNNKPKFSSEQNRAIVELFAKYTVSHGLEPTHIVHEKNSNKSWDGRRQTYINNSNGVPENIKGEFFLITTSPDRIPCIVSKSQRDELIKQGISIYGIPVNFLPYSTNSSIKDNILISEVEILPYHEGSGAFFIINDKDDLKNSTFVQQPTENRWVFGDKAIKLVFDNKSHEAVELHGTDYLQSDQLILNYKDKKDNNWFDMSNIGELNFKKLDTDHTHNLWVKKIEHQKIVDSYLANYYSGARFVFGVRTVGQWIELDPENLTEDGTVISEEEKIRIDEQKRKGYEETIWKITNKKNNEYREDVQDIELGLYKTLKSINGGIGDKLKIEYEKHPLLKGENAPEAVEKNVISYIKDYEKDHKNELKKESGTNFDM